MNHICEQFLKSIEKCVRPHTYPVAIKLIPNAQPAERPQYMRTPMERTGHTMAVCQVMGLVRRYGWSLALEDQDYACPPSLVYMGYYPEDTILEGMNAVGGYVFVQEAGKQIERVNKALPLGMLKEMWFAPLEKDKFEPDIVVVYGNPAQIGRLIHAANYKTGKGLCCTACARAACSSYIVKVYEEQECTFVVPSGGERVFGMTQDDEVIFAIPFCKLEEVTEGLEATHKAGLVRFPTPYQGLMAEAIVPEKYWKVVPPSRRPGFVGKD